MKKLLCIILSIAITMSVFLCLPLQALADNGRLGDSDTYYSFDASTSTLTISGSGNMPNFYNSDESIPWYSYSDEIDSVIVEEGITSIGAFAFYSVSAQNLSLPSTLEVIGTYAMAQMSYRGVVEFSYGLTNINANAFYGSSKISGFVLPASLEYIGSRAFQGCSGMSEITIPHSVKTISNYAFYNCRGLKSVSFENMTSSINIGANCFTACTVLKSIAIPSNAVCNNHFYGYLSTSSKYSDVKMYVYQGTNAENYAIANDISYDYLDSFPIQCAVEYKNTFTVDNMNKTQHYTFVPSTSEEYCFCSYGNIDVSASLFHNGELVAENNDVDRSNQNFCIEYDCVAGDSYDLYVSSINYKGDYTLEVLPTDVKSITISGEYSISASDGKMRNDVLMFGITSEMLSGMKFTVEYSNGITDCFVYSQSYYNGGEITVPADRIPLQCGSNDIEVNYRSTQSSFVMNVSHSYTESTVDPTPKNDGYILHSCINCDDSYKDGFFASDKKIYTFSGKCVLSEDRYGNHTSDYPYFGAVISVGGDEYEIDTNGEWTIKSFGSCMITLKNKYGDSKSVFCQIDENNPDAYYGTVVLDGYDMNMDGYINARDYAIYKNDLKDSLGDDYWQFGNNFISTN